MIYSRPTFPTIPWRTSYLEFVHLLNIKLIYFLLISREKPGTEENEPTAKKKRSAAKINKPATEEKNLSVEKEKPATDKKKPAAEKKKPVAEKEKPTSDKKKSVADKKKPAADKKKHAAKKKKPSAVGKKMSASEKYVGFENLKDNTNAASVLKLLEDFGISGSSGHTITVTKRTKTLGGIR